MFLQSIFGGLWPTAVLPSPAQRIQAHAVPFLSSFPAVAEADFQVSQLIAKICGLLFHTLCRTPTGGTSSAKQTRIDMSQCSGLPGGASKLQLFRRYGRSTAQVLLLVRQGSKCAPLADLSSRHRLALSAS